MKKKNANGQTLIEVVIALSILLVLLIPLLSAATVSVFNATFAKNQSLATKYAQEGMENLRSFRDSSSWSDFWAYVTGEEYCFSGSNPGSLSCAQAGLNCLILNTHFGRCFKMEDESGGAQDKAKVTVNVYWQQGGKTHQSKLISSFTKWQYP